jgi:hypothetical protein
LRGLEVKRWRCTYPGKPETLGIAASGHVAPSWDSFDKRVWEKGDLRITLTNLHLKYPERQARAPGKIAVYRVLCEQVFGDLPYRLSSAQGTNWTALVKSMKEKYG